MKVGKVLLALVFLINVSLHAQVGIGTSNPDPSSVLDIQSSTQGLLAPRMNTVERLAISNPADGLLVYDTDDNRFYYYDTDGASWDKILADDKTRDNYVLVKNEADFPPPSGGKIVLATNTLYEINGSITLSNPIDLNGAYLIGNDTNEDVLDGNGGTIFSGNGGSVRNITLTTGTGGTVFDINGGGSGSFIMQSSIVRESGNVGTIQNCALIFMNVIQYLGNASGITYSNSGNLLLNNQGWFGSNGGIYETLTGSFNLIEKVSGFSQVIAAAAALDVTGVATIGGDAVLQSVVFYGGGNYINGNSPYTGYNFSNDWSVNCPGIPVEIDDNAGANFYYDGDITNGFMQTVSNGNAVKIVGSGGSLNTTEANSLFRFRTDGNNKLVYEGTKTRDLQVNASLSIRVRGAEENFYAFIIAKNGTVITESNSILRINNDLDIQNIALNSIVTMSTGDYIEIYVRRLTGGGDDTLVVFSENLSIK